MLVAVLVALLLVCGATGDGIGSYLLAVVVLVWWRRKVGKNETL